MLASRIPRGVSPLARLVVVGDPSAAWRVVVAVGNGWNAEEAAVTAAGRTSWAERSWIHPSFGRPSLHRFLYARRERPRGGPGRPSSKPSDPQSPHTSPDSPDPPSKISLEG